jgi:DNA-binding GntR family transcriptional regulator
LTKIPAEDSAPEIGIAEHIQSRILAGYLPPGTKLGEEMLSEIYNLPRSRVRRVLQMLSYARLVDLLPNRGAFIASPSPKEAADVLAARRVIESVTTEIVARTILTHRINALRDIVTREMLLNPSQRRERIELAGDFHRLLAQNAHNAALTEALEPLILRSSLILAAYPGVRRPFSFTEAHLQILDEIERGRSRRAGLAMERCLFALQASLVIERRQKAVVNLAVALNQLG